VAFRGGDVKGRARSLRELDLELVVAGGFSVDQRRIAER